MGTNPEQTAPLGLEVIGGPLDGERYVSRRPVVRIGRVPVAGARGPNDLVLAHDPFISSFHAQLWEDQGQWWIQDQRSRNGTWVEGRRLAPETAEPLRGGQHFIVGYTVLRMLRQVGQSPPPFPEAPEWFSEAAHQIFQSAMAAARQRGLFWLSEGVLFCTLARWAAADPHAGAALADFFARSGLSAPAALQLASSATAWEEDLAVFLAEQDLDQAPPRDPLELTPRLATILRLADNVRRLLDAPHIEPLHLLAGLLQEGGGQAALALENAGHRIEDLLAILEDVLQERGPASGTLALPPGHPLMPARDELAGTLPLGTSTSVVSQLIERNRMTARLLPGAPRGEPETAAALPILGIDFGATGTVAAVIDERGQGQALADPWYRTALPSVVYIKGNRVYTGEQALRQTEVSAGCTAHFFKNFLGNPRRRFRLDGADWKPEELVAFILKKVARNASAFLKLDRPLPYCILAVPPSFTPAQRQALALAARLADLKAVGLVPEPIAACLAHGLGQGREPSTVLSLHFGGSSFSATLLRLGDTAIRILGHTASAYLGARDWDERIVEHLSHEVKRLWGLDPRQRPELLQVLYQQAEQAKIKLSGLPEVNIPLSAGRMHNAYLRLRARELDAMTRNLVQEMEALVRRTLRSAGIAAGGIDEFLIHGGGASIPAFRRMVQSIAGKPPRQLDQPEETIARGSAIYAAALQLRLNRAGGHLPPSWIKPEYGEFYRRIPDWLLQVQEPAGRDAETPPLAGPAGAEAERAGRRLSQMQID